MAKVFSTIQPDEISVNTFKIIGSDWILISAGNIESYNMMTASWGGFGVLWNKKVCFCFIRPVRYTFEFMEKNQSFTFNFFDPSYKKTLEYCGSISGRDVNKTESTGLTPIQNDFGSVYFEEASLVLACRKIYFQDINPEHFLDNDIENNYPEEDYHRMYIGEILRCLKK